MIRPGNADPKGRHNYHFRLCGAELKEVTRIYLRDYAICWRPWPVGQRALEISDAPACRTSGTGAFWGGSGEVTFQETILGDRGWLGTRKPPGTANRIRRGTREHTLPP